jgi:hypothetical protein
VEGKKKENCNSIPPIMAAAPWNIYFVSAISGFNLI